jgi:hypothetical protein
MSLTELGELPVKAATRRRTVSREIILIESFQAVEDLIHTHKTKLGTQIRIRIPEVSAEKSLRWERDLNEALQEWGCLLGARCGFAALCLSAVWFCFHFPSPSLNWILIARDMLIITASGGLLGKVVGFISGESSRSPTCKGD